MPPHWRIVEYVAATQFVADSVWNRVKRGEKKKRKESEGAARISSIHGGGTPAKVVDTGTPKKE